MRRHLPSRRLAGACASPRRLVDCTPHDLPACRAGLRHATTGGLDVLTGEAATAITVCTTIVVRVPLVE